MTRRAATLAVAGLASLAAAAASACGESFGASAQRAESERYVIAWRTRPAPPPQGQHFDVDVEVCPKAGAEAPESVRVDAHMPEHRHGMNYRPMVTARGPSTWRAEGLLFHMPGRWEYVFELRAGNRTDRATAAQTIE